MLDRLGIATKRLKIHNKKVERRESSVEPQQPPITRHQLPPVTLEDRGLSHLARSSHHLDEIQPLLQKSF